MEIRVGPPTITTHSDELVLVCQPDATMVADGKDGLFVADTRLVSSYRVTLSGNAPTLLNSAAVSAVSSRHEFTNPAMATRSGKVDPGTLHLRLDRTVGGGVHEDYDLANYGAAPVELDLEVVVEGDYADLLDVKAGNRLRRGSLTTRWDPRTHRLVTSYVNGDFRRGLVVAAEGGGRPELANGSLSFPVRIDPHERWHACLLWMPVVGDDGARRPPPGRHSPPPAAHDPSDGARGGRLPVMHTSDPGVDAVLARAAEDLPALSLTRYATRNGGSPGEAGWVPAAGIPWFATLFGRDSLVVALQTLCLSPSVATGVLRALGDLQSRGRDDRVDAQAGKVHHEVRHGELAHLHLIPQTPYYGTHDATSLYVRAAAETWRWTGDRAAIDRLRPHVERALEWIDRSGDLDGDGLQEYKTYAGDWGYYNLGWKDSGDAIVHDDGSRPDLPIALCELQGYVVAAKRAWAVVLEEAYDDARRAQTLRSEADRLVEAVEARFWWEEQSTYFLGLDGRKQPIRSVTSNPGHLLWAGAVAPERAAAVVRRLLADDMWSGWGVRTLSSAHPSYNPLSYQRGSVWPHDNAILVAGFAAYGHAEQAGQVARGVFDAAERFRHRRLPEVFAGLERDPESFPVEYRGANVPQAWASGAALHLVSALVGLRPDAVNGRLDVEPMLPPWLSPVTVSGLAVGDSSVDLCVGDGDLEIVGQRGPLEVSPVSPGRRGASSG